MTTSVIGTKNRVTTKTMIQLTGKPGTTSVISTQVKEMMETSSSELTAAETSNSGLSTESVISTEMEPNTIGTIANTPMLEVLPACSINSCKKNDSLFELDGTLIDWHKYGSWRDVCGELYVFGKSLVSWQENVLRCCSLGMQPISFETSGQFQCILNITKSANWPYNMNYWTSGRRTNSPDSFQWCLSNEINFFNGSGFMWAPQQPDNVNKSEDCVHLSFPKNISKTGLTDKNCDFLYLLGCKGSTTPAPKCHAPLCPNIKCVNNDTLFSVANDSRTKFLSDPKVHGTWINIKGRIYIFSKTTRTWQSAAKACCDIGTKLLSVDNDYEYGLLTDAIKETNGAAVFGQFWTSATDEGCKGAFGWCSVNKLVRGAVWANGMPEIGKRCITVDVDQTNTTLKTSDCSTELHYICETRDLGNATSGGRALKDECAAVYNISEAEQDSIFNGSKLNQKLKCFLKCLGENGGVFLNGYLVDDDLITLAESLAPSNTQQLQSDLLAVGSCGKIKGMDECDTAALTFQCGQENAAVLVANAISSVELSISQKETSPLQSSLGVCISDFTCINDQAKLEAFKTSKTVTEGSIETRCGTKYFIGLALMTYREAASKCCEYGLGILALDSPNELDCLTGAFMGGKKKPFSVWTSASRKGAAYNAFRWCTSKVPMNVSDFPWDTTLHLYKNSIASVYINYSVPTSFLKACPEDGYKSYFICEKQRL